MNEPQGIGEILESLKKKSKLGKQLDQAKIWEHWPELIGEPLWMHGKPRKFRDKRLVIEAESSVWMHRFTYEKQRLIKRINRLAGYPLVDELFVTLAGEEKGEEPNGDST